MLVQLPVAMLCNLTHYLCSAPSRITPNRLISTEQARTPRERRKVVTLSNQDVAQLQPLAAGQTPYRAALLISRNKRLLQRAATTCCHTHALCARTTVGGRWTRTN